jgi:protein TonB
MHGILHSLQIGTLSTWLSLTTFGTVGVCVHPWQPPAPTPLPITEESVVIPNDFLLEAPLSSPGDTDATSPTESSTLRPDTPDLLPAPPELVPLADLAPLPEIPDLPPPPPVSAVRESHEAPRASIPSTERSSLSRNNGPRPSASNSSASGSSSGSSLGSGTASTASRLAAGRMPAPAYPSLAKRNGQTGTVVVEFTIGTDGRVISAYAQSPSPHASLNEAAVRAVRHWKFPPGGVMKTQRPIVFQLR